MYIREDGLITNIYPNNKEFDNLDKRCRRNSKTIDIILSASVVLVLFLIMIM